MAKFNIFVNVYVYYPEVYNGTTIEERLNKYFRKYFIESSTYIKFYTAPTNENQIMVIEAPIDVDINNNGMNFCYLTLITKSKT